MKQENTDPARALSFIPDRALAFATTAVGLAALVVPALPDGSGSRAIGWLLILGGLIELLAARRRRNPALRRRSLIAAAATASAGALFAATVLVGFLPTVHVVMIWLLVRAAVLFDAGRCSREGTRALLWLAGITDLLLCLTLLIGVQISTIVIVIFGPTPELVASFSLVFAASFIVTGLVLLQIVRIEEAAAG